MTGGLGGGAIAADARPTNDAKEADEVQVLDKEASEQLEFAKENLRIYAEVLDSMQSTGNQAALLSIRNAMHKEEKKIRTLSKEHPGVLQAVAHLKAAEDAAVRKRMLAVQDANDKMKALCDINREIAEASRKLKRQRAACKDAEAAAHVKNSVRKYSLPDLGHGKRNCGGEACKKKTVGRLGPPEPPGQRTLASAAVGLPVVQGGLGCENGGHVQREMA